MKRRRKTVEEILMLEYVSLTELGILFNTSSHLVGRWLEALGFWTQCGKPTRKARDAGLVRSREYLSACECSLNTWHLERTVAVLIRMGRLLRKPARARFGQVVSKYIVAY